MSEFNTIQTFEIFRDFIFEEIQQEGAENKLELINTLGLVNEIIIYLYDNEICKKIGTEWRWMELVF